MEQKARESIVHEWRLSGELSAVPVRIDKEYRFERPVESGATPADLLKRRSQIRVYNFNAYFHLFTPFLYQLDQDAAADDGRGTLEA